jgi:hypothetical protein
MKYLTLIITPLLRINVLFILVYMYKYQALLGGGGGGGGGNRRQLSNSDNEMVTGFDNNGNGIEVVFDAPSTSSPPTNEAPITTPTIPATTTTM